MMRKFVAAVLATAMTAGTMTVGTVGFAHADYVPPFKGNDTGGIISTGLVGTTDVDQMAIAHCAQYGKVPKKLGAPRAYGMYLSFACVWVPTASDYHPVRVRY